MSKKQEQAQKELQEAILSVLSKPLEEAKEALTEEVLQGLKELQEAVIVDEATLKELEAEQENLDLFKILQKELAEYNETKPEEEKVHIQEIIKSFLSKEEKIKLLAKEAEDLQQQFEATLKELEEKASSVPEEEKTSGKHDFKALVEFNYKGRTYKKGCMLSKEFVEKAKIQGIVEKIGE